MARAEEKAVEYQIKAHGPNVMGGASMLSEEEYMRFNMNYDFKAGYESAEKDLGWHSVEESLPEIDEEVIVLSDVIHGKKVEGANWICFGHLVDKRYCVDYDGWNFPGVHHWMRCPKIPNEK